MRVLTAILCVQSVIVFHNLTVTCAVSNRKSRRTGRGFPADDNVADEVDVDSYRRHATYLHSDDEGGKDNMYSSGETLDLNTNDLVSFLKSIGWNVFTVSCRRWCFGTYF